MKAPLMMALLGMIVYAGLLTTLTIPGEGIQGGLPDPGTIAPLSPLSGNNTTAPLPPPSPFILSRPPPGQATTTWLYASPGATPCVMYDRWEVYAFGKINASYSLRINGKWINGTMTREYVNLSYDASKIDRGNVSLRVGSRSWAWTYLIVRHKDIGYSPDEISKNPYDQADLIRERNRTATAVILAGGILAPPVAYIATRRYIDTRGVQKI